MRKHSRQASIEVPKLVEGDSAHGNPTKKRLSRRRVVGALAATSLVITAGVGVYVKQRHNAERAQATAEQMATLENRLDRISRILGGLNGVDTSTVTGEGLKSPATLPGYEQTVSPELRDKVKNATVQIGARPKTNTQGAPNWMPNCTATKISHKGRTFILSASHCFPKPDIKAPIKGGGNEGTVGIRNITTTSPNNYVILDTTLPEKLRRNSEPLARVTGVAIDGTNNSDFALLSVQNNPLAVRDLDSIPAVDIEATGIDQSNNIPELGQQAALYSAPAAAGEYAVTGTGIYIGRVRNYTIDISEELDLVAINPAKAEKDACHFGGSGSSAVFANGSLTGPLSFRNPIGYGPNQELNDEKKDINTVTRLKLEAELGLNLDNYSVICGYTVPHKESFDDLVTVLNDPTKIVYPPTGK